MKPKHKKGEIPVHLFMEIMIGVVVILILLLGYKTFITMKEKSREAISLQTEERMRSDIETIALRVGSSERVVYDIPEGVAQACFVDTSVDTSSIALANQYPIILDLIQGDPTVNFFLIYNPNKIEALSVGPVCIPPFPHYICFNTTTQKLDAMLEGKGNCTIIRNTLFIKGMNLKNLDKYPDGVVFVVPESADPKDIYRLIPLAFWKEGGSAIIYPLLVMYESPPLTKNDYLNPLTDNNIDYTSIVFFTDIPFPLSTETFVVKESLDNYFNYWLDYDDIILISDIHEGSGVAAGLFAASLNAPLVFINEGNIHIFRDKYQNRKAHILGSIPENIRKDIENNARDLETHTLGDISNPTINPFLELSSTPLIDLP